MTWEGPKTNIVVLKLSQHDGYSLAISNLKTNCRFSYHKRICHLITRQYFGLTMDNVAHTLTLDNFNQ